METWSSERFITELHKLEEDYIRALAEDPHKAAGILNDALIVFANAQERTEIDLTGDVRAVAFHGRLQADSQEDLPSLRK